MPNDSNIHVHCSTWRFRSILKINYIFAINFLFLVSKSKWAPITGYWDFPVFFISNLTIITVIDCFLFLLICVGHWVRSLHSVYEVNSEHTSLRAHSNWIWIGLDDAVRNWSIISSITTWNRNFYCTWKKLHELLSLRYTVPKRTSLSLLAMRVLDHVHMLPNWRWIMNANIYQIPVS